ncbi:MAG: ribosomal-processing cysteine protease Prp [Treponema sp.]|nr:ribosomal-processing cysteine protease Prp [Treponema sp.]
MTTVLLRRSQEGVLLACRAKGHAGYAGAGFDIVCSSITILLRTTMQVISEIPGIKLNSDCSERGNLSFEVDTNQLDDNNLDRLVFAGDFLETGLGSVAKEYPEYLEVKTVRN